MSPFPDITDDELLDEEGEETLAVLASWLPEAAPDDFDGDGPKSAIFASIDRKARLAHFAEQAAELLDIDEAEATRLLDAASQSESYVASPFPGVRLFHIDGGPKVAGAITGFVRIEADAMFPDHDHLGDETVLVVQGSCIDMPSGEVFRSGDVVHGTPGGVHSVVARPGPDLVYLAVLFDGLKVGDMVMRPDDPDI